ncbi:MAG: type IV pilus modification protein PilV [Gammaproteobacteria bacterium]
MFIKKNKGFTLLEALIGFLILSIGMLGIASLQAISLKSGKTSVYGSVAMMKVDELFESMRANPSETALTAYEVAGAGVGIDHGCTGAKDCTEVQLAQEDVFWWKQNLTAGLPDTATTAVSITTIAPPPSRLVTVKIDINWNERDKDADGSVVKTFTATTSICTQIPC